LVALYVLAVIGAAVVARWLLRPLWASRNVRRAAIEFHAASIDALATIREAGPELAPHDLAVRLALRRWVSARTTIRGLSEGEQQIVEETLKRRRIVLEDVVQAITAFMEQCGRANGPLAAGADLAPIRQPNPVARFRSPRAVSHSHVAPARAGRRR
jgi:hypothetical protein